MRDLGKQLGKVLDLTRLYDATASDMDAFHASGECYVIVFEGINRKIIDTIDAILTDSGYEWDGFKTMVAQRVSAKWLYHSGLLPAFDMYQEEQDTLAENRDKLRRRQQAYLPGARRYSYV